MKHSFWLLLSLILSFSSIGKLNASPWLKAQSDHFIFYSEASEDITREYLGALEAYHHYLGLFLPGTKKEANDTPFTVYFLNSSSDFKKIWPEAASNVAGFVTYCEDGMFAVSSLERNRIDKNSDLFKRTANSSLIVLFHEYAHEFMLRYAGASFPKWFVEGFAEYYSTMRFNPNGEVLIGVPDSERVWSLSQFKSDYSAIIQENLNINSSQQSAEVYAQYWILTHYLLSSPQLADKLNQYFSKRIDNKDRLQLFEQIFGIKSKDIYQLLENYQRSQARMNLLQLPPPPKIDIQIEKLSNSVSNSILLEAAILRCPDQEQSLVINKKLEQYLKQSPNEVYLQDLFMRSGITSGSHKSAIAHFKKRTEDFPNNSDYWYYLGRAILEESQNNTKNVQEAKLQLSEARAAFLQSYKLKPGFPPNLFYLSLSAQDPNNPDIDSVNSGIEAYLLEPSIPEYSLNAIRLEILSDQYEYAKQDLEMLIGRAHLDFDKSALNKTLEAINNRLTKSEILSLLASSQEE